MWRGDGGLGAHLHSVSSNGGGRKCDSNNQLLLLKKYEFLFPPNYNETFCRISETSAANPNAIEASSEMIHFKNVTATALSRVSHIT